MSDKRILEKVIRMRKEYDISSLTVDKLKKCHNPCKYKGCGTFICIHEI